MRSVNFAQRIANVIVAINDRTIVVVSNGAQQLLHLLHALLGTTSKRTGYWTPKRSSSSEKWMECSPRDCYGKPLMPAMAPIVSRISNRTAGQ